MMQKVIAARVRKYEEATAEIRERLKMLAAERYPNLEIDDKWLSILTVSSRDRAGHTWARYRKWQRDPVRAARLRRTVEDLPDA